MSRQSLNQFRRPFLTLLLAAFILGPTAALRAQTVVSKTLIETEKRKIRKAEEIKRKILDKRYAQQAMATAKRYQQSAKLVKSSGGNPQPLLDAAKYYLSEARAAQAATK